MRTARATVDWIPRDEGLPQLRRLLDPDEMATVLARLAPDVGLSNVRVVYLRYKPATRLVVRYRVTLGDREYDASAFVEPESDLAAWAVAPEHVALARKVHGRTPALRPLSYDPGLRALIQWLPLDLTLPALAEEPAALRRLLREAGVEIDPKEGSSAILAYKPRRRGVLRLDGHVVKIYAGAAEFDNAVVGLCASGRLHGLSVPSREAVVPTALLTCQSLLAGEPPAGHHAAAHASGSALARLHVVPSDELRAFPPERQLAAAASSARSASAVVPGLARRLERLMRGIERSTPDALEFVTAHGDFHANQVLELDGDLAVIDFDEICAAPSALDFSSYVAHLVDGGPDDFEAACLALDDLVAGYGTRPDGLGWYVATSIVRRVPFPFRFMAEEWTARMERMVGDAEEALAL